MIAYFETSALVKLLLREENQDYVRSLWEQAIVPITSRLSYPEAMAAFARARRGRRISPRMHQVAKQALIDHMGECELVEVDQSVASFAGYLAETHALRGYDAVHLASALTYDVDCIATWDRELARAASAAGLRVGGAV